MGACTGIFSLAAFAVYVVVPAWNAYSRGWQRAAAMFLALYVLLAMIGTGAGAGFLVVYFWDRIG
ncbi:MAG: hypothetical protein DLM61_23395 [Pseudonocardiales bacterium]|nr:MAG: hypothetical protein DLM61_23395 [Pseudonocardiales bacterium]